jgi:ABC-type sugar transport system substrate-binding protein
MTTHVYVSVPPVVAEVIEMLMMQEQGPKPVVHATNSLVIRQRVQAVRLLADTIQAHPQHWGVWSDADKRWLLASRLLEMRERVRSCAIAEAAEEAAL